MGGPVCDPVRSSTTKPNTEHAPHPQWRLRAGPAHEGHHRRCPDPGDRPTRLPWLLEAEVSALTGAQLHGRCPGQRSTHRNGYRERLLTTQVGDLTLANP